MDILNMGEPSTSGPSLMNSSKATSGRSSLGQMSRIATPACFAMNASRPITATAKKISLPRWHLAKHLELIDDALMDLVVNRDEKSAPDVLILQAPPRHGKSELISKYLPSWYLGRYPDHRVILASYSDHLARSFGRKCRDILNQRKEWFGIRGVKSDVKAANEWDLAGFEGGMMTAGVGGPLTGRGADLLIIDDPIKNAEQAVSDTIRENHWDWFQSTAWTRLEPGGICVVMMTRWHDDDLVGKILKLGEDELGITAKHITLPALALDDDSLGRTRGEALWPERWPVDALEKRRGMLDEYWWQAMYQQKPGQFGRNEWPDDHFGDPFWATAEEWPTNFEYKAIAVDPSKGREAGDFSGIVFMGLAQGMLWVDSIVRRLTITDICHQTIDMFLKHGADRVGLESNSFQDLIAPEIERCQRQRKDCPPLPISLINNSINKKLRIGRLGPYLHRHSFRFLRNRDNDLLVKQLKGFPLADYDDGPDAQEMALRLLNHVARVEL